MIKSESVLITTLIGSAAALIFLLVFATLSAISATETENIYRERCISAGGVFIDGQGMDFCVKEFMPIQGDK